MTAFHTNQSSEMADAGITEDEEEATPTSAPPPPAASPRPTCGHNCYMQATPIPYDQLTPEQRQEIKIEYYKSYDLMTGVRTAACLGGTILLFSLFILYKMKCRAPRKRPLLKATTTIDSGGGVTITDLELDGMVAAPPAAPNVCHNGNPGTILAEGRRGSRIHLTTTQGFQLAATAPRPSHPRFSCGNILPFQQVSSSSAVTIGPGATFGDVAMAPMPARHLPAVMRNPLLPKSRPGGAFLTEPIDIQIIQPTPNVSPCGSVRRLSDDDAAAFDGRAPRTTAFIPLLSLPQTHHHRQKGREHRANSLALPTPSTSSFVPQKRSSGPPAPGTPLNSASKRHAPLTRSGEILRMKFIDCSDSDAVSLSSGGGDSEVGSPPMAILVDQNGPPPPPPMHTVMLPDPTDDSGAQNGGGTRRVQTDQSVSETSC